MHAQWNTHYWTTWYSSASRFPRELVLLCLFSHSHIAVTGRSTLRRARVGSTAAQSTYTQGRYLGALTAVDDAPARAAAFDARRSAQSASSANRARPSPRRVTTTSPAQGDGAGWQAAAGGARLTLAAEPRAAVVGRPTPAPAPTPRLTPRPRRRRTRELQELVHFLHGVPLWAEVPWDRLLPVAAAMVRIDAERGEVVLRQGELLRGMYVVASGRCRAERDVSIDGAPPPSPPSPPPGLDTDDADDDATDAAAAAAPASRVARVFVRTIARRECFGDVAMLLPRALLKKSRRARETVTAEVATTVYFLPKSEAPAVELGPNGQREARLSVLLAPSDASLRKAYIDDIEWAEAKRQYVERVLAEAYERKAATARRTRIVSLMPSASPYLAARGRARGRGGRVGGAAAGAASAARRAAAAAAPAVGSARRVARSRAAYKPPPRPQSARSGGRVVSVAPGRGRSRRRHAGRRQCGERFAVSGSQ